MTDEERKQDGKEHWTNEKLMTWKRKKWKGKRKKEIVKDGERKREGKKTKK